MLAAVERDHLAGHGGRGQDEADSSRDLRELWPVLQGHRGLLVAKLLEALALARERRAWPDAIDADPGRQRQSESSGQGPERALGNGVGKKIGGQLPDPLIEKVDDIAVHALWKLAGEGLAQHQRRAQIGLDMTIP